MYLNALYLLFFTSTVLAAPTASPVEHGPATPVSGLDLAKRESADDATDPAKVLAWMKKNVDLEADRAVFYSGQTVGQPMARAFCDTNEEDGYKWFYTIFDGDFSEAFGGADPSADADVAKACSQAFAQFATGETRVFNDVGATSTSFWKTIEYPGLNDNAAVTKIWNMTTNTLDPNAHNTDLKNNAAETGLRYVPGYCGIHVKQYQKNEGPGQTSDYRFDITLFDGIQAQIGQALLQDAPTGVGVGVDSALPLVMVVTAGPVDSSPVSFSYGSDSWDSNGGQCSVGRYDSGSRQIDCGFTCATTQTSDV